MKPLAPFKRRQRNFRLWMISTIILSLLGGYWVAIVATHLLEQRETLQSLKLINEQDTKNSAIQQVWLKRLHENEELLKNLSLRQFINPPHRENVRAYLEELAEGLHIDLVRFGPETILKQEAEYYFCQQEIVLQFTAAHDLPIVQWLERLSNEGPGLFNIIHLQIEKNKNSSSPALKGEVLLKWLFLRFSFS